MGKLCEFASLLAVILLVYWHISGFDRMDGFMRGPLNPYAFFTDEVRCALEQASAKVVKGDLSAEDAKTLLGKWDVRRCVVGKGTVGWTIAYYSIAKSVEYVYSPGKPFPGANSLDEDEYRPLGNNWYWRRIR